MFSNVIKGEKVHGIETLICKQIYPDSVSQHCMLLAYNFQCEESRTKVFTFYNKERREV